MVIFHCYVSSPGRVAHLWAFGSTRVSVSSASWRGGFWVSVWRGHRVLKPDIATSDDSTPWPGPKIWRIEKHRKTPGSENSISPIFCGLKPVAWSILACPSFLPFYSNDGFCRFGTPCNARNTSRNRWWVKTYQETHSAFSMLIYVNMISWDEDLFQHL